MLVLSFSGLSRCQSIAPLTAIPQLSDLGLPCLSLAESATAELDKPT